MNRRHSLIQPAPSVRAGAGRRQGKVGLLQREGDHPWRRSFPATFQHPLSPCDTVTRLEVHKGGVWTQEQRSLATDAVRGQGLCTRRQFCSDCLLAQTRPSYGFGRERAHRPMKQREIGAPDTIRTCDLCLRSTITYPSEKCDRARYATLSSCGNWIFSTTTATFLSETPHRFSPACLRVAYLGDRARNEGTSWSRSRRGLSRRRMPERRTT